MKELIEKPWVTVHRSRIFSDRVTVHIGSECVIDKEGATIEDLLFEMAKRGILTFEEKT